MSVTIYKITDRSRQTYGGYQWVPGEWHTADGRGDLCGPGWLHAYDHPLLAVLHNPLHGNYRDYLLWEGEAKGRHKDDHGLRRGSTRMRIVTELPVPTITIEQQVRYAIGLALAVYPDPQYVSWATGWRTGRDRTAAAAEAASAARAASAAWTAMEAARAARAATEAARAATEAARAARTAAAAEAAARAATIDLVAIAEWAISTSVTPPFWAGSQ